MLTPRQIEILSLIIQLYGKYQEPVGSKTLLSESVLEVSPATIRNDMVVLEKAGLLIKTHTSSGRVPSHQGYQSYLNRLMTMESLPVDPDDRMTIESILETKQFIPMQLAQLAADMMSSLTGLTTIVLGQDQERHCLEEFKFVPIRDQQYLAIMLTDNGKIESEMIHLRVQLSSDEIAKITALVNDELQGVELEEVYQRMKLSIPLLTQRIVGYQLDFSLLIEKAMNRIKGHRYYVSGKSNLFRFIDAQSDREVFKMVYELIDGSPELYQMIESHDQRIEVIYGKDFTSHSLNQINLVLGTYMNQNQKITIGIFGPKTMPYHQIIPMMNMIIGILENQ